MHDTFYFRDKAGKEGRLASKVVATHKGQNGVWKKEKTSDWTGGFRTEGRSIAAR